MEKLSNNKLTDLRKLKQKKERNSQQRFLIEGIHLIEEALKAGILMEVYSLEPLKLSVPVYLASYSQLSSISQTDTPSPVIGMASLFELPIKKNDRVLILDNLQDPGNAGTLIRSACAFNFDVVYLYNSVDKYNDKLIRATQGALFHIPVATITIEEIVAKNLIVADIKGSEVVKSFIPPFALVIGNESRGVSTEIRLAAKNLIKIKMSDKVESLNAAVAGSIFLHKLGEK